MPQPKMTKTMRDAIRARDAGDRETIFWSQQGEICCAVHMPHPGTDTWTNDRWMLMAMSDRENWQTQTDRPPRCESCR